MSIVSLAREAEKCFVKLVRSDNETYWTLSDDAPEWVKEMCQQAHGDFLPDDYRYEFIQEVITLISAGEEEDDYDSLSDVVGEIEPDIYNNVLTHWLASNLNRAQYVDEAIEQFGLSGGIFALLSSGQVLEKQEVFQLVLEFLSEKTETEEEV